MLAIVTTHPIQYQVPLWRALAADGRVPFEVWFLTRHGAEVTRDKEFGKSFAWDVDPLEGYPHRFLEVNAGWDVNRFGGVRLAGPLGPLIRERGVRAVWLQGWQVMAYWQAAWQAKAAGAEVWLRGESNDLGPRPGWKRLMRRAVLGRLFSKVNHFLCIGSANRRMYEAMGVAEEKLHWAPYCVDNARFARQAALLRQLGGTPAPASGGIGAGGRSDGGVLPPLSGAAREAAGPPNEMDPPARLQSRREWNVPDDAFCVLFCGKFIGKKRPGDLVAAARRLEARGARLGARGEALHLLFVGSGELGAELRAGCDVTFDAEAVPASVRAKPERPQAPSLAPLASNDAPRASFPGFLNQTQIPRAYAAADCLVLPSDHGETWGLVVNEAMASGVPCVVSDACGCAEDLVEPELRYPCGDVGALARAIAHVRDNREALAARCRERVKAFDLGATVDAVAGIWNHE